MIPCYTPECKGQDCIFCQSDKTNLCPKIRAFQGSGVMPDGTSRISKDGKEIFHFMGCSTFAEYSVIAEISAAKIHPGADLNKMCLLVIEFLVQKFEICNCKKHASFSYTGLWSLHWMGSCIQYS